MAFGRESHIEWSVVSRDFEPDGALRDICVQSTTLTDWQTAFDYVRVSYAPLLFTVDHQSTNLPAAVEEIFSIRDRASPLLNFDIGGIDIACHFFTHTEIEFDLRPEEVTGSERLAAVVLFVRGLAAALCKPVLLTMENVHDAVILRADPAAGTIAWIPPFDAPAG